MPLPSLPQLPLRGRGRPRTTAPEIRRTVLSTDWHCPQHDSAAFGTLLNFIGDIRPDYHIVLGDVLDLPSLSTFLKDPALEGRTEEAIAAANAMLDQLHAASPTTITKIVFGNHDYRLTKSLWMTPEILPFVTKGKQPVELLSEVLSLNDRQIDWYDYREVYDHYGFALTHGEAAGLNSAKKELETHSVSGASGHVHATRYWEHRGRKGVTQWWSLGGIPSRDVSYRPNNGWIPSIALLEQVVGTPTPACPSGVFTLHPLPIIKGQFVFNSKIYNQDGSFAAA
jgi:hypothetical protein